MKSDNIIGQRIKERKEDLKITSNYIANQLRVDKSTVSNWIIGHRKPEVKTLVKLSYVLRVSLDYLTGATDEKLPYDEQIAHNEVMTSNGKLDLKKVLMNGKILQLDEHTLSDEERLLFLNVVEGVMNPKYEIDRGNKREIVERSR
jgi:transcriptional regulator with XRE-family HTH domain